MFTNYKVVCVTPAGRRRYLRILVEYILSCPFVDEYQLWRNTTDAADVEFMHSLASRDRRVRIIEPSLLPPFSNSTIRPFYKECTDEGSLYIRFDDDIVFLEPGFFETFLQFRIQHPEYFVVFPNTINNAVCTYIQATRGRIKCGARVHPWCMDLTTWGNPHFAEQLHRSFLKSLAEGSIDSWYFGPQVLALSRFSINCMSWFGHDFASFGGEVCGDEEEYLSVIKPTELGRPNCIYGDAVVSHFAFHPQRPYLDSTDILAGYNRQVNAGRPSGARSPNGSDPDLWTPRLLRTVETLSGCQPECLRNTEFIADCIRYAGLVRDHRLLYGDDNCHMNTERIGLWQVPIQLARLLVELSKYDIRRILDVGTGSGWTVSLMTAYLYRFNRDVQVLTIDLDNFFDSYASIKQILPIEFKSKKRAQDYCAQQFDCVFLDAEHEYDGCRAEYHAVGVRARLCAIHDINDRFVSGHPPNDGGVPRFWKELKNQTHSPDKTIEFLDHSRNDSVMGIGLLLKGSTGGLA